MKEGTNDNEDPFQPIGLAADRLVKSLDVSELAKRSELGKTISRRGFLGGIETTDDAALAFSTDGGAPLPTASLKTNAHESSAIRRRAAVPHILGARSFSEVHEPIIGGISVCVIDNVDGPRSMNMEPNHAMGEIVLFVDHNATPPATIETAGDSPNQIGCVVRRRLSPDQIASCRDVVEQAPDLISGHNAAPVGIVGHHRVLEVCEQKKEDGERDAQHTGDDEKRNKDQRAYVEQRLRELAAFEERFRSGNTSRRKRN